jgi:hypothetical protein
MDDLVVVDVVASETEAELACGLLRSAGIECTNRQTNRGAGAGDGMPAGGPRAIMVRGQDAEIAGEVLGKR